MTENAGVNWDADGNPDQNVSCFTMKLAETSTIGQVRFDLAKKNNGWGWLLVQYSSDGGTTWKEFSPKNQIFTTSGAEVRTYEYTTGVATRGTTTGPAVPGVTDVRVNFWLNGSNNPGEIAFDNIIVNGTPESNTLPNENFDNVGTPAVGTVITSTAINGVVYTGYTTAEGVDTTIGTGLSPGAISGNYIAVECEAGAASQERNTVTWDADGNPDAPITNVQINLPEDSTIDSVSMDLANAATGDLWIMIQYSDDNGVTWTEFQPKGQRTSNNVAWNYAFNTTIADVDIIRVNIWRNGGTSPGEVVIDNIVVTAPVPVANNDNYLVDPTVQLSDNVITNDDLLGQPLYAHVLGVAPAELVSFGTDGSFVFDTPNWTGDSLTFSYELTDSVTQGTGNQVAIAQVQIERPRMVHHWEFDNALTDSVGSVTMINSGAEAYAQGVSGQAFDFSGSNYGESNAAISLGEVTEEFTISTWVKIATAPNQNDRLLTFGSDSFGLHIDTDRKVRLYMGGNYQTSPGVITLDTWHNIVFTKNSANLQIYVDGVSLVDNPKTLPWSAPALLTFGSRGDGDKGTTQNYDGLMDEVQIYNYERSAAQILADYETFTPVLGFESQISEIDDNNSLLTWQIDAEVDVKEYRVLNLVDGQWKLYQTVIATGLDNYSLVVPTDGVYLIEVVDLNGTSQHFYPSNDNIDTVEINLVKGWNLISLPVENSNFTRVFTNDFWTWNGTSYELGKSIEPLVACWVYVEQPKTVVISGENVSGEITLKSGWNMVGPANNCTLPKTISMAYSWDEAYQSLISDYDMLKMGIGYWLFSFVEQDVVLD